MSTDKIFFSDQIIDNNGNVVYLKGRFNNSKRVIYLIPMFYMKKILNLYTYSIIDEKWLIDAKKTNELYTNNEIKMGEAIFFIPYTKLPSLFDINFNNDNSFLEYESDKLYVSLLYKFVSSNKNFNIEVDQELSIQIYNKLIHKYKQGYVDLDDFLIKQTLYVYDLNIKDKLSLLKDILKQKNINTFYKAQPTIEDILKLNIKKNNNFESIYDLENDKSEYTVKTYVTKNGGYFVFQNKLFKLTFLDQPSLGNTNLTEFLSSVDFNTFREETLSIDNSLYKIKYII
uniref:Uncharacterized protein n=1 Tax=viral metagenome TaxID=1070528 RepID=A0A6C0J8Z6_9ZZZZ